MHYKITLQEHRGSWVYVIAFGNGTPTAIDEALHFSGDCVSAEDPFGTRHYACFKDGKLVQIQLYEARRILPHLDPERPETIRMPAMQAIMFGSPPSPTLLLSFTNEPPDNRTAYAIAPNIFLVFHGPLLSQLYVTDVYSVIPDPD